MPSLDDDIELLRTLQAFLRTSFKGASFGQLKLDEATEALGRTIAVLEIGQRRGARRSARSNAGRDLGR